MLLYCLLDAYLCSLTKQPFSFHKWERQSDDLELGISSIDIGGDMYVCGSVRMRLDKLWPGYGCKIEDSVFKKVGHSA